MKIWGHIKYFLSKKYRADCKIVHQYLTDYLTVERRKLPITEACRITSEKHPSEWPEEVLFPYYSKGISKDDHTKEIVLGSSIFGNTAHVAMDRNKTISLVDALLWTELCSSRGDVKKAIKNNGIMVNRNKIHDINYILAAETDRLPNIDTIVLEFGKYNFGIIELC